MLSRQIYGIKMIRFKRVQFHTVIYSKTHVLMVYTAFVNLRKRVCIHIYLCICSFLVVIQHRTNPSLIIPYVFVKKRREYTFFNYVFHLGNLFSLLNNINQMIFLSLYICCS